MSISGTIIGAICKYMGLHSGYTKMKLVCSRIRATQVNITFGIEPSALLAGPGKNLKFWPMHTSLKSTGYYGLIRMRTVFR
jgi:hypothetical protein